MVFPFQIRLQSASPVGAAASPPRKVHQFHNWFYQLGMSRFLNHFHQPSKNSFIDASI
jgi:hypothetical protein